MILEHELQPSYKAGFAPRDGLPVHANLMGGNSGLVGAWPTSLGNSGLTLRDWSGHRQDATLSGSTVPTWAIDGGSHALFYDNSTSFCDVGATAPHLDLTVDVSIFAWLFVEDVTGDTKHAIYANRAVYTGTEYGYAFWLQKPAATSLRFMCADGSGNNNNQLISSDTSAFNKGEWFLAGVTKRGTECKFFVNGEQSGVTKTLPSNSATIGYSGQNYHKIGSSNDTSFIGGIFRGSIADLHVWNRPLPSSAIRQLYSIGRGGLWQLEDALFAPAADVEDISHVAALADSFDNVVQRRPVKITNF